MVGSAVLSIKQGQRTNPSEEKTKQVRDYEVKVSATWNHPRPSIRVFALFCILLLHSSKQQALSQARAIPRYYHNKMGKPKNNKKKSTKKSSDQGDLLYVNPSRIRYQHSRIRPTFSGCGRNVMDTLEEIRRGDLNPYDLPVIQVC